MFWILLLASFICCIIYVINEEISTREFVLTIIAIFISVVIVYTISLIPLPNDSYFESGRLYQTQYYPYFVEKYQQPHTICVSTGKTTTCTIYYTTEYAKHHEYWLVWDTLNREWEVSKNFHNLVKEDFGNIKEVSRPNKCTHGGTFYKGDPNVYTYNNKTNTYNYPTNNLKSWHNPIKGKTSLFNNKVDIKKTYPKSLSVYKTNRKQANTDISDKQWDIFNTKIYERVKANVILVEMKNITEISKLEDLWLNGKLNDLVICFTGDYKKPENVKVFGWSDSALVRLKLEDYILDNGIQKSSLDGVLEIITNNYKPYDMSKFNYLTNPPSIFTILICLIVSTLVGVGCIKIFSQNWENKNRTDDDFWSNLTGGNWY